MKTKAISSFFVLFAIAAGIVAMTPAAFADHAEVTVEPTPGSGAPGCEETPEGCFIPSTATVDVGGVVIFSNTDSAAHTFTSGEAAVEESVGAIFDSSLAMAGSSFEWSPTEAGEVPYFCIVHPWMAGLIIVQEAGADDGEAMSSGEELIVEITTGTAGEGERLSIDVAFTTMSGDSVEHVNYNVKATQNDEVVLDDMDVHDHDGVMNHMTAPLPTAASDDAPVDVEVTFNGFGIDPPFTGPVGQVAEKQVVPEFGTIAMMILAVAIISIVAVTAKSRVIPRF
jgi:predicted secreted protein with PEFG-CTERM motif